MKKKNLKSLRLNKKSISKFNDQEVIGGTGLTGVDQSCHWFTCATQECPSALLPPYCLVKHTEIKGCR